MLDIFSMYFKIIERIVTLILGEVKITFRSGRLHFDFRPQPENSYTATLKKLDRAKQHMTEAVSALDTLRDDYAEENKRLDSLISAVQTKKAEYEQTSASLATTKELLAKDQSVLREALGINDRRSKIVGFVSGVVASLLATGIWIGSPYIARFVIHLTRIVRS